MTTDPPPASPPTEHAEVPQLASPELPSPELVEQRRRSVAMLRPGVWAFRREEAIEVLELLGRALRALRTR